MNFRSNSLVRALAHVLMLGGVAAASGQAATISWTNWASATSGSPGSASGTISASPTVTVTYTGQNIGLSTNYPSWNPASTFSGGTVSNAPPAGNNAIALTGGTAAVNSVGFSTAITNPVLAIWSLGQPGAQASFNFTASEPFTIEAGGPSAEYGGSSITASGNNVYGSEGNGVVQFNGTFSSLSWTNPTYEGYYAFTLGIAGVASTPSTAPEPAAYALSGLGLAAMLLLRRGLRFVR